MQMNKCFYFENGTRCNNIVSVDKKYCTGCLKKPQYIDLLQLIHSKDSSFFKYDSGDPSVLIDVFSIVNSPHFDFRDLPELQKNTSFDLKSILRDSDYMLKIIFKLHYFTMDELLYFLTYLDYDYSSSYTTLTYDPFAFGMNAGMQNLHKLDKVDFSQSFDMFMNEFSKYANSKKVIADFTILRNIHRALQKLNCNCNYTLSDLKQIYTLTNGHFSLDYELCSMNKNTPLSYVLANLDKPWDIDNVARYCVIDCDIDSTVLQYLSNSHTISFFNKSNSGILHNLLQNETFDLKYIKIKPKVLLGVSYRVDDSNDTNDSDDLEFDSNNVIKTYDRISLLLQNCNLQISEIESYLNTHNLKISDSDLKSLINNTNIRVSDIQKYNLDTSKFEYDFFRTYKYLTVPEVYNYIYKNLEASKFSGYRGLNLKYIQSHPEIKWDYNELSFNNAFSILDVYDNIDLPWNYTHLIGNCFNYKTIPKHKIDERIEFEFDKTVHLDEILNLELGLRFPEELIVSLVQYL